MIYDDMRTIHTLTFTISGVQYQWPARPNASERAFSVNRGVRALTTSFSFFPLYTYYEECFFCFRISLVDYCNLFLFFLDVIYFPVHDVLVIKHLKIRQLMRQAVYTRLGACSQYGVLIAAHLRNTLWLFISLSIYPIHPIVLYMLR